MQTFEFILCRNCLIIRQLKINHPSQCERSGNIKQPNKNRAQRKHIINTVEIIHAKAKLIPGITQLLWGEKIKKKYKKGAWALCLGSMW